MRNKPENLFNLNPVLSAAERGGYAVGSFSPRYTAMIKPVLQGAQALNSPLIVQISQKELTRHQIQPREFADEFYHQLKALAISVPVVLHLDHTKDFAVIQAAIEAGFTSVMIDASEKPFQENVDLSREVVDYAHPLGVSVEAELGRIGTTDFVETEHDEELYTVPEEAQLFVSQTGIDALAASVGTAHGVYRVRQPKVDLARLAAIRALTSVHLVLHGGSGVPGAMIAGAVAIAGGGVSKVNIATDLELAALATLGRDKFMTNAEMTALPKDTREQAQASVRGVVEDKILHFLNSAERAADFHIEKG
ncbi:MAG: class II fructose-bisphosphate aldolase [Anaerolineae bacterium]|nr:class II fructose-bisphosphate aldolase [Anaerolineae bacterium]